MTINTSGASAALEPRGQSTRPPLPLARGYRPPHASWLAIHAFRLRKALRARLQALGAARYGEGDIYLAFIGGLLIAACVIVPFLPRLTN